MHTFHHKGITFHFNSDLSGDVKIGGIYIDERDVTVDVDGGAILALVAEVVRRARIAELEGMTDQKVLGMPPAPKPIATIQIADQPPFTCP